MIDPTKETAAVSGGFDAKPNLVRALISGAKFVMNVEQTRYFFEMTDAIDGPQNEINFQRFLKTETGARLCSERFSLRALMSNERYLSSQPLGSLAHDYLEFLARENLTLDMLMDAEIAASNKLDKLDLPRRNFITDGYANHDLLHVLTGYGRDPLGEALLLTFTAEQFNFSGVGATARTLILREKARFPNLPIIKMFKEAKAMARATTWIAEIDWRDELGRPACDVRVRLGMPRPRLYERSFNIKNVDKAPAQTLKNAA